MKRILQKIYHFSAIKILELTIHVHVLESNHLTMFQYDQRFIFIYLFIMIQYTFRGVAYVGHSTALGNKGKKINLCTCST